jgi:hypothetical protein
VLVGFDQSAGSGRPASPERAHGAAVEMVKAHAAIPTGSHS